jgi:hypothetical protein
MSVRSGRFPLASILPLLAAPFLMGCPPEEDPVDPDPRTCEVLDTAGLASGGNVPAGCWLVQESWSISGDVTVEADTQFVVDPLVAIRVLGSGSLSLPGTEETPIVFEGSDAVPGSWVGIAFEDSPSSANTWSFVTIRHAGGDTWTGAPDSFGALFADGQSRLDVTALTIEDAVDTGLHLYDEVELALEGLNVSGTAIPARMSTIAAGNISGDVRVEGDDPTIHLRDGTVDTDVALGPYGYTVEEGMYVTEALTIAPGARFLFESDIGLHVETGSLNAVGTPDAPITFEGVEAIDGWWMGLQFENTLSTDNQLSNVAIRHAGSSGWTGAAYSQAALYLQGSEVRLSMEASAVELSESYALVIDGIDEADKISIASTVFQDCEEGPAVVPDAVDSLAADVVVQNNDTNHVRLLTAPTSARNIDEEVVMVARDAPYYVDGSVFVFGSLDIEAGATVVFADDTGISAGSWPTPGGLLTIGDASGPEVLLTGENAAAGFWKGIAFQGTALGNSIVNTRIEYAGSSGWNGSPDSQAGLYVYDNSSVQIADVTFDSVENLDGFASDTSVISDCSGVVGTLEGDVDASVCVL